MASNEPEKTSRRLSGDSRVEMKIPANAEWVRVVRLATAGVAGRAGFSYDDVEDIKLAVAEACNNAILHSTDPRANEVPLVTIAWELLDDGLRISVSDTGRLEEPLALKPRSALPSDTILEQLPESGLGLLLIESLMDEVEHESGPQADTTIHMTKRLAVPVEEDVPASSGARPDPDSPVGQRTVPASRTQAPAPTR